MGSAASQFAGRSGTSASLQRAADSIPSIPSLTSLPSSAAMSRSHSTMSTGSTPASSSMGVGYGSHAHNHTTANPLEIFLDSDHLVLRGQGGDMAPAYLSGYVSLWLAESTNIKDITMNLSGKAKVHFSDSSR